MYILKNALISISRNKGRNLLIGIIVVVIACAASITLAIRNSASTLITSYENKYDVIASIGINRESMRGQMRPNENMSDENKDAMRENMQNIFSSASNISISDIEKYADSKYVSSYYYNVSVGALSDTIEKVSMTTSNSENENFKGGVPPKRENFKNTIAGDFTLVGYSNITTMEDFVSGKYKITEGEMINDDNVLNCVINSELASYNNISIGNEITFKSSEDENVTITLKVTGIFEEESSKDDMMGMFTSSANMIITNAGVINDFISKSDSINKTITPSFVLINKDIVEDFSKELTDKGLNEYLSVTTNLDEVENATKTISNVNTFATTFLAITLIIGGIVLFVINMINIRERKYEIGVLRIIGMKKSLLTIQFIFELLVVSFISLLIGTSLGALSSVKVSNHLLQNEINAATEEKEAIRENFGGRGFRMEKNERINGITNTQAFDSIDAVVDFKVLVQLLGIGIVLTLISSSASMISIQKFSPLTILKERS